MQIQCVKCGLMMEAGAEYAGMAMTCPACRTQFQVPSAPSAAPPPPQYGGPQGYQQPPQYQQHQQPPHQQPPHQQPPQHPQHQQPQPPYGYQPPPQYGAPGYPNPAAYQSAPPAPQGYPQPQSQPPGGWNTGAPPGGYPPVPGPGSYAPPPAPPKVVEAEPASMTGLAPMPGATPPAGADDTLLPPSPGKSGKMRKPVLRGGRPGGGGGGGSGQGLIILGGGGLVVVLVILVIFLVNRGKGGAAGLDPDIRSASVEFCQAAGKHDIERVWQMLSKGSRANFESSAPEMVAKDSAVIIDRGQLALLYGLTINDLDNFNGRKLLTKLIKKNQPWSELGQSEVVAAIGSGNKRRATLKSPDGRTTSFNMVQEDGKWKFDLDPDWK